MTGPNTKHGDERWEAATRILQEIARQGGEEPLYPDQVRLCSRAEGGRCDVELTWVTLRGDWRVSIYLDRSGQALTIFDCPASLAHVNWDYFNHEDLQREVARAVEHANLPRGA